MRLATSLAMALDPVRLAEAVGLRPDPWQADLLRSTDRQIAMLCSRQSGKSSVGALLAVDEALHRAPALVLCLAPSLRQAQELFRKIKQAIGALDDGGLIASESALAMELRNGSRILALPGKESTVRGFSNVALLLVDEAAWVPDALYQAIRPMLAVSGGRIVLLSTPFGRRGFFHHEYTEGGPDWKRVKITAHDCPRISEAWLEQERNRIGDFWFEQEYLCRFKETDDQVFGYDLVMGAISDDLKPFF